MSSELASALTPLSAADFQRLADAGHNRIPLVAQSYADLDTPLSLYLKLVGEPGHPQSAHSFLLESVVGGERFGRYSFIGLPARTLLRASGYGMEARTEVVTDGQVVETLSGNPLDVIEAYQARFKAAIPPGLR